MDMRREMRCWNEEDFVDLILLFAGCESSLSLYLPNARSKRSSSSSSSSSSFS